MAEVSVTYKIGDAVWIKPEDWRGEVSSVGRGRDGPLYLVSIVGQNRARWCRPDALARRSL